MARRQLVTWHDDNLTRDNYFICLKKIQKNKKKLKKSQKIQELTRGIPFNVVTVPLTEKTKLRSNIPKQGPN